MATGIFRPDTAEAAARALAANARAGNVSTSRPVSSVGLQQQLANVNWAGLAQLANASTTGGRGSGQYLNTGRPSAPAATFSRTGSADTAEALGAQRSTGVPYLPGAYVGGEDRPYAGGAVVNGVFIPGGTTFRPGSPSTQPTPGGPGGTGSTGSTGGISGGVNIPTMGGAAGTQPSADQITQDLLAEFDKIRAEEDARIIAAGQALSQALTSRDPMAAFQPSLSGITVPTSAMMDYLRATNAPLSEVEATQRLGQEILNQSLADIGQYTSGVEKAAQDWRQRQIDVGAQLTADAQRQLALNAMAAKMGIRSGDAARRQNLANEILALALQYGKLNANGTITQPTIPMTSITLPGGQIVQLPSTLFPNQ